MGSSPTTRTLRAVLLLAAACLACDPERPDAGPKGAGAGGKGDDTTLAACPDFAVPMLSGRVEHHAAEISGIAVSRDNPGALWAHNDHGEDPIVFAFDRLGRPLGSFALEGAQNVDWEDIALGPGPGGADHLYVGDIGDVDGERDVVVVYRVREPALSSRFGDAVQSEPVPIDADAIELSYADGEGRDAEALFVDPVDSNLVVLSRARDTGATEVFTVPVDDDDAVLRPLTDAERAPHLEGDVVAADISADGSTVVVAFDGDETRLWRRAPGESLAETFAREPCTGPAGPKHTRAIAIAGDGYVMVPEGASPRIVFVEPRRSCPEVTTAQAVGSIDDGRAVELSGLVASRRHAGVLWTHNDGSEGLLLALDADSARIVGEFELDAHELGDWEDLALGPGPKPGRDFVYAADTGDNGLDRDEIQVLRFAEPADPRASRRITSVETFALRYPGGQAHDAEGLVVDPNGGDLYVFTKRNHDDPTTRVFRAATDQLVSDAVVPLSSVITDRHTPNLLGSVVAADVSPSGDDLTLLFQSGERALLLSRDPAAPLWAALQGQPCSVDVPTGQLEAIALSPADGGLYVVPEGKAPTLSFIGIER
jgi:hypothetical protein